MERVFKLIVKEEYADESELALDDEEMKEAIHSQVEDYPGLSVVSIELVTEKS